VHNCQFATARSLLALLGGISEELTSRARAVRARHPPRDEQDAVPTARAMQSRHEQLRRNCERRWDADMRPRYFVPSQRLQTLRQRALDVAKDGTEDEILDAIEAADDQAAIESEIAGERYRKDRENALAKLARKHNLEMRALVKGPQSEIQKRRSERVSRQIVPRQP
jgi:hypothetical protein